MTAKTSHTPEEKLARLQKTVQDYKEQLADLSRQNRELVQQNKDQELFLDHCPVGLVLIRQGRIMELNQTALEQMGYEKEEVRDRIFWDFVDPASKNALKERAQDRRKGKWAPARFETTLVRKDGTRFECEIRMRRFRYQGRAALLAGLIGLDGRNRHLQDLTQSLKTEALLTMAQGLKQQLTPGFSILTESCLLLKKGNLEDPDSLIALLDQMQTTLARIQTTLNPLDDLARTGYDPGELSTFNLKELLQTLIEQAGPLIQAAEDQSKTKIHFKTYARAGSRIRGHFKELVDALLHLLRNALEAMPAGGDLYLSTEESAGQALIYIQDSGSGISDELQARVLDPFFSTKGPGRAGLGLSLAAAIVQRHHGTLEQNSSHNQGTMITVKLPVFSPETEKKDRPPQRNLKNAAVLLIDHQDLIRPLLAQLLTAKGVKVVLADSGRAALIRLKARSFDLAWIGTLIPDMPKSDLLQEIKKLRPQTATAVVLDHPDQAQKIAADLLLDQPLDMNKAVAQVIELLRGKN